MATGVLLVILAMSVVTAYPQEGIAARKNGLAGRVVGGSAATIENYPYVVTVWRTDLIVVPEWFSGGGSVFSNNWIITGAQAIFTANASDVIVRAGSTNRNNGTRFEVERLIIHPSFHEFSDGAYEYDIALLRLQAPLVYSATIQPISLPAVDYVLAEGTLITIVGWGSVIENGLTVTSLRQVSVPYVPYERCRADNGADVNNGTMLCAGYAYGGSDSCDGDVGDPLLINSTQVGLVSWGFGCGRPNRPGVNTNLLYFRDWILSETSA